ncbi:MAG: hypothetical protein CMG63_04420 [Candidatus Marinimicrobia bacterium]|nr:hypothetical protein [Candidatus Neomarinimicrobiota bacterium]|tara:strand:+ start:637 stop:1689 length:1053 start_codon:yes stop_codon:yes gene_type:complete
MKIFIPSDLSIVSKKNLFLLVRPFFSKSGWTQFGDKFRDWSLIEEESKLVSNVNIADVLLIPFEINYYFDNNLSYLLKKYNNNCKNLGIQAFGYISGDFALEFPYYSNITYFRMGGFKSKLNKNNKGFPAALSDYNKRKFGTEKIKIRSWSNIPTVGFCGHATPSASTYFFQTIKIFAENVKRFINDPFCKNYEKYFQSAYHRYQILKNIEKTDKIFSNFIFREKYRDGAKTKKHREVSTYEYYDNIINVDYVVCLRGTGNFSIRLYETLMMGRIPIFIDTDCILPFYEHINWEKHILIVSWSDRFQIPDILKEFHDGLGEQDFKKIQIENRKLWLQKLQPRWILNNLTN